MTTLHSRLGEILVEEGSVRADAVQQALEIQKQEGGRLGEILCRLNHLTAEDLAQSLSLQYGCPCRLRLSVSEIDSNLLKSIPYGFARRRGVLPIRSRGSQPTLVLSDPSDLGTLADIRLLLESEFEFEVAPEPVIDSLVDRVYEHRDESVDGAEVLDGTEVVGEDLLEVRDSGPIINLMNKIMVDGVRTRASDIHIEPGEHRVSIRCRVDGVMHTVLERPMSDHLAISSRVKVMAGLNIAEKRLPQDGALRFRVAGRAIDARVSTVPTVFGERVVLRLLDKERGLMNLADLGLDPKQCRTLEAEAQRSSGIMLATGPTGSGKTTTLYALLRLLCDNERNIMTIEDPVEYQVPGVNQIQVHAQIGMTFANGLRSMLRQDPDVMMVGEIRDLETAEIAVRAALTGHLVLSTLHTIDSFRAVARLLDMGVEPFLLADALNAVLAQRLVRLICRDCAESYSPEFFEREILEKEGFDAAKVTLVRGRGCEQCFGTGYRGRASVFEILRVTGEVRDLLVKERGKGLAEVAKRNGIVTLRSDGVRKAIDGQTTLREVLRVLNEGESQISK